MPFLDSETAELLDEAASGAGHQPRASSPVPTVLLIEDDPISVEVTRRLLKKAKVGASVATNYTDAIRLFEELMPDVVLVDINVPWRDGMTAEKLGPSIIRTIRDSQADTHPQIVALTASEDGADHDECMHAGADKVLLKSQAPALLATEFSRLASQVRNTFAMGEVLKKLVVISLDQTEMLKTIAAQTKEQADAVAPLVTEWKLKQETVRVVSRAEALVQRWWKPLAAVIGACAAVAVFIKTGRWPT